VISDINAVEAESYTRSNDNPGALLNINNEALQGYKKMKQRMSKLNRIDELESQIDRLTQLVEKLLNDTDRS